MNASGDPYEQRLAAVETTLNDFKTRLNRIEQRLGMARFTSESPAPPPKMEPSDPARRVYAPYRWSTPDRTDAPRQSSESTPRPATTPTPPPPPFDLSTAKPRRDDVELKFGSVVLPRVGAGVVLLGIGYLVALGITDGWITPLMQFWGAILLCLTSIGIGFWNRQEKFDFGQVLIGLGSCGLYIAFACGHVFQHLYSGEMLVAQFLVLSLANLLYGALTPSRTFTAIGLLGGMVSASLPMREHSVGVSLWLHAAIVLPTAAVLIRHKWREMALGAWLVSSAALLLPMSEEGPWMAQIAVLYGSSLALLFAYAWSHEGWEFDSLAAFLPVGAMPTGIVSLSVTNQIHPGATAHLILFGTAVAASSLLLKNETARKAMLLAGILPAFILAPQGLLPMNAAWAYLALAAFAAAASLRLAPHAATTLSGIGFLLSVGMYAWRSLAEGGSLGMGEESLFLVGLIGLIAFASWVVFRWYRDAQALVLAGAVLVTPFVARLAVVLLGIPAIQASGPVAIAGALLGLSAAGATVAAARKWEKVSAFGWTVFVGALLFYGIALVDGGLDLTVEAALLLGAIAVIALNARASGRSGLSLDTQACVVLAAGLSSPFIARLFVILMREPSIGASNFLAVSVAMLTLSAAGGVLAIRKNWKLLAGYSWATFAVAALFYSLTFSETVLTMRVEVSLLLAMLATVVLCAVATGRTWRESDLQLHVLLATCVLSPFISRLTVVLMGAPAMSVPASLAVATAMLGVSMASAVLSLRRGWALMAAASGFAFLICALAYLGELLQHPISAGLEIPLLAVMLGVVFVSGAASGKNESKQATYALASFMGWGVFSRLVYVVSTQPGGLSGTAAITLAWILYAVVLIVSGFLFDLRSIRLTSLAIFGMTLGKIMLYDLAGLSQGIRVVLLILLGAAMIGGGYWYVRRSGSAGSPPALQA